MEEINEGVRILCEQMESNPDAFTYEGKFASVASMMNRVVRGDVADEYWQFSEAEKQMLFTAYRTMSRQRFTASIVHALMAPKEEVQVPKRARGPLTSGAMRAQTLGLLTEEFGKAYAKYEGAAVDTYKYVAEGRYNLDK